MYKMTPMPDRGMYVGDALGRGIVFIPMNSDGGFSLEDAQEPGDIEYGCKHLIEDVNELLGTHYLPTILVDSSPALGECKRCVRENLGTYLNHSQVRMLYKEAYSTKIHLPGKESRISNNTLFSRGEFYIDDNATLRIFIFHLAKESFVLKWNSESNSWQIDPSYERLVRHE